MDERVANHQRAIDAALAAGVSLVAYTSTLQADTAATVIGATHRATEEYLRERRVPSVLLRNGWYLENYTGQLPLILQNGGVIGAVGRGEGQRGLPRRLCRGRRGRAGHRRPRRSGV